MSKIYRKRSKKLEKFENFKKNNCSILKISKIIAKKLKISKKNN